MTRLLYLLLAATVFCPALALAAQVYEGPSGEIFIGDYLPREMEERGYVKKGATRQSGPAAGEQTHRSERPRFKKEAKDAPVAKAPKARTIHAPSARRGEAIRLALPGESWALELPSRGFTVKAFDVVADGASASLYAENAGLLMAARVDRHGNAATSGADCRKRLFDDGIARRPVKREGVKQSERAGMAFVEYMVRSDAGVRIDQWNMHSFQAFNGACASVHLSRAFYARSDAAAFREAIDAVRIDPGHGYYGADYYRYGAELLAMGRYAPAAAFLKQAAAELGREGGADNGVRRMFAIEMLGGAYAMAGDARKAKETFRLAISSDPSYPFFYYSLAVLYAAEGDVTGASVNVMMAVERRANAPEGRGLPDPVDDPAFGSIAGDERFRRAVRGARGP